MKSFKFGSMATCCYCGDPATSLDHIIPVAIQTINRGNRRLIKDHGPVVWSCADCNNHLSSRRFNSFTDRCRWASERLNSKAKPIIWSNDEISKLSGKILSFVKQETAKRKWLRNRADWYESRDFYLNIESLLWEPALDAKSDEFSEELHTHFMEILPVIRHATAWK